MKTDSETLLAQQSNLIKAMRFPLIVLVVFAHSAGVFNPPTIAFSLDQENVFHFFSEFSCRHLCSIGTCWFFVFSGYLFFLNKTNAQSFSTDRKWYYGKWKKRIHTLLLPYLLWNLLAVLVVLLKTKGLSLFNIPQSTDELSRVKAGPLFWFLTGPADYPLWFLRDLIVLTILAPVLEWLYQRIPFLSLVLLVAVYLLYWSDFPVISMRGFFFFSLGAWFGIRKTNLLTICQQVKILSAVLASVLAVIATFRTGLPDHVLWLRLFYPFGMITFLNICNGLIKNEQRRIRLENLAASVFFIYAAHTVYILGWTKGLFVRLFGEGLLGNWIKLLFVPVVVLFVCMGLYYLLNRLIPKTLALFCGGRT